jgi:hypothetical protein
MDTEAPPDDGTLRNALVITGPSKEKTVSMFVPAVMLSVMTEDITPEAPMPDLHRKVVAVCHAVVWHIADETLAVIEKSVDPKLRPCNESCAPPEYGLLAFTEDAVGASNENTSENVPESEPTVTCATPSVTGRSGDVHLRAVLDDHEAVMHICIPKPAVAE